MHIPYIPTISKSKLQEPKPPFFTTGSSLNFASYQLALQAVLELLGTHTTATPVVMSVLSSTETLAAVMNAGGSPIALDVDSSTMRIDPAQMKSVLEDLKGLPVIVVLEDLFGEPPPMELVDAVGSAAFVYASKAPPSFSKVISDFEVYDLVHLVGPAAIVRTKHYKQVQELRLIRSGDMGLSANLNDIISDRLISVFSNYVDIVRKNGVLNETMHKQLIKINLKPALNNKQYLGYKTGCPILVNNPKKVAAHLQSYEIETHIPFVPIHHHPRIAERWADTPVYPEADILAESVLCLPIHSLIEGHEETIVSKVQEVANG